MTTAILQMLVFLGAAFAFAAYLLKKDKEESQPNTKVDDQQQSIDFPDYKDDRPHRGAAMSRL